MCERIKPWDKGEIVPHGLICRGTPNILVLAFLFLFWFLPVTGARANDLALNDNVAITLAKRIEMLCVNCKTPVAGNYQLNIFLSPGTSNFFPTRPDITSAVSKHIEMPRASGKLMIAGGLGKRILTVSAELYDPDTHSWLTKGDLAKGRAARFSTIPFNSRIMVWVGIIVPF